MVSPELPVSTVRRSYSFDCSGSDGRKVNGGDGSNFPPALPEYILPPASVSFFTPEPSSRSSSESGTQNVLGLVAESKK